MPPESIDTLPARLANLAKGVTSEDIVLVIRSEAAFRTGM